MNRIVIATFKNDTFVMNSGENRSFIDSIKHKIGITVNGMMTVLRQYFHVSIKCYQKHSPRSPEQKSPDQSSGHRILTGSHLFNLALSNIKIRYFYTV